MKIETLHIFDWVYCKGGTNIPFQVKGIEPYRDGYIVTGWSIEGLKVDDIAPIPLSRDIMLRNGFTENPHAPLTFWWKDMYVRIGAHQQNVFGGHTFQIAYVHELQGILRCVGFRELADNLKIKGI